MDEVDKKTKDIINAFEKKQPIKLSAMSSTEFKSIIKRISEYINNKNKAGELEK